MIVDDPFGGEPMVVVPANLRAEAASTTPGEPGQPAPANPERPNRYDGPAAPESSPSGNPPGPKTITIIDGSSGKRQDVIIGGSPDGKTPDGKAPDGKAPDGKTPESKT